MPPPNTGPQPDYALDPDTMTDAIRRWLSPVIDQLAEISGGFTAAHGEVTAAHASETVGWYGGKGNDDVRMASSSFFNELEYQVGLLAADQAALAQSLRDYRTTLEQHIKWAQETDQKIANGFHAIEREMTGEG